MGFISDDERIVRADYEQRQQVQKQTWVQEVITRFHDELPMIVNRVEHEARRIYAQHGYVDKCTISLSEDYWPLARTNAVNTTVKDALRAVEPQTMSAHLHHVRASKLVHITVRFNPSLT